MQLHDQKAKTLIASALQACLNGNTVEVLSRNGVKPAAKIAVARCMGATARVFRIRHQGYGLAFEATNIIADVLVNIEAPAEEMVSSVMRQTSASIAHQAHMRATAAALGIYGPLKKEEFCELDRLTIDLASAVALRRTLGSDQQVRDWLRGQLSLEPTRPGSRAAIRVVGVEVRVPFNLGSLTLVQDRALADEESMWTGNEVKLWLPAGTPIDVGRSKIEKAVMSSPVGDRELVQILPSPHPDLIDALDRWNARSPNGRKIACRHHDLDNQCWSAVVEERLVRVIEAFG